MAEDPVVFISYRRSDASGDAGRLYDSLRRRLGRDSVFMDVDSVQPGADWVDAINNSVSGADIMLAVIGPDWLDARDDAGQRRLDYDGDHVRLELEAALEAKKPIIPLLVEDADLPKRAQLPVSLQPLLRHQAYRLSHQTYGADVQGLVRALRRLKRDLDPIAEPDVVMPTAATEVAHPISPPPQAADVPEEPEPPPATSSSPPTYTPPPPQPAYAPPPQPTYASAPQPYATPPQPQPTYSPAPVYIPPAPAQAYPPSDEWHRARQRRNRILTAIGAVSAAVVIVIFALYLIGSLAKPPAVASRTPTPPPRASFPVTSTAIGSLGVTPAPAGGVSGETVHIGVDLPLSEPDDVRPRQIANGVELALADFNAAHPSMHVMSIVKDDAKGGVPDPATGAANIGTLALDDSVLGIVGPYNSQVARSEIPLTNQFGIAQCSPTAAGTDLTGDGSGAYQPHARNFFRIATPFSVEGTAMALMANESLGATKAYVMAGTTPEAMAEATAFADEFVLLGNSVTSQVTAAADANGLASQINSAALFGSDVIFSSVTDPQALVDARNAMVASATDDVPFLATDAIFDADDTFVSGVNTSNIDLVYASTVPTFSVPQALAAAYQTRFGSSATSDALLGYSCAQVLLQALGETAADASTLTGWREAIRAQIIDDWAVNTYVTPLGTISFDGNGDITEPVIAYYRVNPQLTPGVPGWESAGQQAIVP